MLKSNYAYATGLIRAMEPKLLDKTDLERMIDAKDVESAFKVLNDTDYADNLLDVAVEDFEMALNNDMEQTRNIFFRIISDQDLLKFLFSEYDFHNIKILIRAKLLERDFSEMLINLGVEDSNVLRGYIERGSREKINSFQLEGKLGKETKEIIDAALIKFACEPQPHQMDAFLDSKYFESLKLLAKKFNNKFIKALVSWQIDVANLKIFLRSRKLERPKEEVKDEFIAGGKIGQKELVNYYEQEMENYFKVFTRHYGDKRIKAAVEEFLKTAKLWLLEKELENAALEFLRKSRYLAFGPEVVVVFFYAKKNASSNVRIVMKSKINQINREEIRQRVREVY